LPKDDPFADFIVHEAAHIFHNSKRVTLGLRRPGRRRVLLDIDFRKRETFAYSCEAYACVLARTQTPGARRSLSAEYGEVVRISDERVEPSGSGVYPSGGSLSTKRLKVILARCAPAKSAKRSLHTLRVASDAARRQ
jgi:hypothetical protein